MKCEVIAHTQGKKGSAFEGKSIDEIIVGEARVSTQKQGQDLFKTPLGLIRYMLSHGHWSPFSMANIVFRIETSRAIGRQLLRHFSVKVQEYSQRYSEVDGFEQIHLRFQGDTNRQSSEIPFEDEEVSQGMDKALDAAYNAYKLALEKGVAKETARLILPECTKTVLFMNFEVRSLITFLNERLYKDAQLEIRELAKELLALFKVECPLVCQALYWFDNADKMKILEQMPYRRDGYWPLVVANDFQPLSDEQTRALVKLLEDQKK